MLWSLTSIFWINNPCSIYLKSGSFYRWNMKSWSISRRGARGSIKYPAPPASCLLPPSLSLVVFLCFPCPESERHDAAVPNRALIQPKDGVRVVVCVGCSSNIYICIFELFKPDSRRKIREREREREFRRQLSLVLLCDATFSPIEPHADIIDTPSRTVVVR